MQGFIQFFTLEILTFPVHWYAICTRKAGAFNCLVVIMPLGGSTSHHCRPLTFFFFLNIFTKKYLPWSIALSHSTSSVTFVKSTMQQRRIIMHKSMLLSVLYSWSFILSFRQHNKSSNHALLQPRTLLCSNLPNPSPVSLSPNQIPLYLCLRLQLLMLMTIMAERW